MRLTTDQIRSMVIEQLSQREMPLLALTVAVRKSIGTSKPVKFELSVAVKAVLRTLILSKTVAEDEGRYSLAKPNSVKP